MNLGVERNVYERIRLADLVVGGKASLGTGANPGFGFAQIAVQHGECLYFDFGQGADVARGAYHGVLCCSSPMRDESILKSIMDNLCPNKLPANADFLARSSFSLGQSG